MSKQLLKDTIGWGVLLWFIGYTLGFILFAFVTPSAIGWIILPIGVCLTLLVLIKKITSNSLNHYLLVAVTWALIAIVFDYLFLLKLLNPADGYYKLDVYIYYALTFLLPLVVGGFKQTKN